MPAPRTMLGIILTLVWLSLIVAVIAFNWDTAKSMTLNEWGDFLAGVSAPLAFIWLVIGYFQQGKELSLNTKALLTQEKELKRQAEATADLVKYYEQHADAAEALTKLNIQEHREIEKEKVAPKFEFTSSAKNVKGGVDVIDYGIVNLGGRATNFELIPEGDFSVSINPSDDIRENEGGVIHIEIPQERDKIFFFRMKYIDELGEIIEKRYEFSYNGPPLTEARLDG